MGVCFFWLAFFGSFLGPKKPPLYGQTSLRDKLYET